MFDNGGIIDDLILASGGDINKIDEIIKGEEDNDNTEKSTK